MIRLQCDYNYLGHEKVLEKILAIQDEKLEGYGEDYYSNQAKVAIKKYLQADSDIYFVIGGTSANQIALSSMLKPYEGVLALNSGHIAIHEAGAIEATGHKVIVLSQDDKVYPDILLRHIRNYNADPTRTHIVKPKVLYLSLPGENGLTYTKAELKKIYQICQEYDLYFYIDGARLAYALNQYLTLNDMANLCDIFTIGGTKCGLPMGEAIVINNENLKSEFVYNIKQRGGLLAKGFILGVGFLALFEDGLYFQIGRQAVKKALYARKRLEEKGIRFYYDSKTNQQFPIVKKALFKKLSKHFLVEEWVDLGEEIVFRFVTNYNTNEKDLDKFVDFITKN